MTYIPCRRSGKIKINAYIIEGSSNIHTNKSSIKNSILKKDGLCYIWDLDLTNNDKLFDVDTNKIDSDYTKVITTVESSYTIDLPKEVFGKEMPNWFKGLVNRYLENQTVDECHRNRRIMTFFMFRIWFVFVEIILLELKMILGYFTAFMIGFYYINIKRLLHPIKDGTNLNYDFLSNDIKGNNILEIIYDFTKTSTILNYVPNKINSISNIFVLFSLPLVPLVYTIYVISIGVIFEFSLHLMWMPFVANFIIVSAGVMLVLICSGFWSCIVWLSKLITPTKHKSEWVITRMFFKCILTITTGFYKFIELFESNKKLKKELLTCNGDANNVTTDIKKIPFKERSINLIYLDIKNNVCKPMRR